MFQLEGRVSAKVQSWSVGGRGDQNNEMEVGGGRQRASQSGGRTLESRARTPAFGKKGEGQWQSCCGLWPLKWAKKARIRP